MPMWHVYILKCNDGSFYTGSTTDTSRRIEEHNNKKGGGYTRVRLPVKMVYTEEYPDRSKAQKREAQIKGWTREQKMELIT